MQPSQFDDESFESVAVLRCNQSWTSFALAQPQGLWFQRLLWKSHSRRFILKVAKSSDLRFLLEKLGVKSRRRRFALALIEALLRVDANALAMYHGHAAAAFFCDDTYPQELLEVVQNCLRALDAKP